MDDSLYASLLDANEPANVTQPVMLSVILSRKTLTNSNANSSVRLAVVARIPRKRVDCTDHIKYTLKYFSFLDDRRRFTNLDALLTRLSPISVVHLSATESAQAKSQDSAANKKKAREMQSLLNKISSVINSRTDILAPDATDGATLTNLEAKLPQSISNISTLSQQLESDLHSLLGGDNSSSFKQYKNDTKLIDDMLSKQALSYLILQENLQSNSEDGEYEILSGDLTSHLTLDRTAMECINLLPTRHAGISNVVVGGSQSNNSIFGVLNQCKTRMGIRMLELWLRQPCVDYNTIMYRQSAVHKMVEEDGLGRDRLRDEGLGGMRGVDVDGLCSKLAAFVDTANIGGTRKALECLYRLHLFADSQLPVLLECLADLAIPNGSGNENAEHDNSDNAGEKACNNGALSTLHTGLMRVMNELAKSVSLVECILDFDAAPREFLVKGSFSDELQEIREELDGIEQEKEAILDEMNKVWEDLTGKHGQIRLEDTDSNSNTSCVWQFRVPDTNATKLLNGELADEVTVHRILKNGVYFSNKELQQLGAKKCDLLVDYDNNQREIVKNAMGVAVTYIPVLERASELIAELDVLASFAHVAAFSPHGYCRPVMTDNDDDDIRSGIELKEARHPCVELQDNIDFIPNDFDLIQGESSFCLITGPNMGGKSTYIRSLGAIIIMAQIGSYVPCTSAKINIVHHLLARVGAGDVQDRGISTFMAEMLETSSILRTATKRSLIIVDELGRGTSTFDGYGLARSISEYIVQNIGCVTVFATHFHELTAMEQSEKCVKNCHVSAKKNDSGLSFLYEVRPGPCLESFGIQVAELANVPSTVIRSAKRKAKELENFDYKRRADSTGPSSDFLKKFKALPMTSLKGPVETKSAILQLFG